MIWKRKKPSSDEDDSQTGPTQPSFRVENDPVGFAQEGEIAKAKGYLFKVNAKVDKLTADFAAGNINRSQFQELYAHYQKEIKVISSVLEFDPEGWEGVASEGASMVIRKKHSAKANAYAIYQNDSGMPVATLGKFNIDPDLLIPMLSSYRSVTQEVFGGGVQATEIEGGSWLCFVPGEMTTMLAVFNNEPAEKQLEFLRELHSTFEQANRPALTQDRIDPEGLVFPHEYFLGKWKR